MAKKQKVKEQRLTTQEEYILNLKGQVKKLKQEKQELREENIKQKSLADNGQKCFYDLAESAVEEGCFVFIENNKYHVKNNRAETIEKGMRRIIEIHKDTCVLYNACQFDKDTLRGKIKTAVDKMNGIAFCLEMIQGTNKSDYLWDKAKELQQMAKKLEEAIV